MKDTQAIHCAFKCSSTEAKSLRRCSSDPQSRSLSEDGVSGTYCDGQHHERVRFKILNDSGETAAQSRSSVRTDNVVGD